MHFISLGWSAHLLPLNTLRSRIPLFKCILMGFLGVSRLSVFRASLRESPP